MITRNVISYIGSKEENKETKMVSAGPAHFYDILDTVAVDHQKAESLKKLSIDSVVVLGDRGVKNNPEKRKGNLLKADTLTAVVEGNKKALVKHMKRGGSVVLLAVRNPEKLAGILGVTVKQYNMKGYWFDYKKTGGLTLGLSTGDVYWKDNFEFPIPDKKYPISLAKVGKGKLIICQVDPLYFPDKDMNQRRERNMQKINRVLSLIFTNLDIPSKTTSLDYLQSKAKAREKLDIDMTGKWKFRIDIDNKGLEKEWQKKEWAKDYKDMKVPGSWEEQGENTPNPNVDGKEPYDGYAWYQKSVVIPASAKNMQLLSEMGAVDDYDWTYFNGKLIGKIGEENPRYWEAKRLYELPSELIKYDEPNTITVRVFDSYQNGGIMQKPVRIVEKKEEVQFLYLDSKIPEDERYDPYIFYRW
jgi:hypothetical protein